MGGENLHFLTVFAVYLGNGTDRPVVTIDHSQEVIGSRSIRAGCSDCERRDAKGQIISIIMRVPFNQERPDLV